MINNSWPELPLKWSEWHIVEEIGRGSFGTVYRIEDQEGNVNALKIIRVPSSDAELQLLKREYGDDVSVRKYYRKKVSEYEQEIKVVQQFPDHSHIVEIYDYQLVESEVGIGWQLFVRMECLNNFYEYCNEKVMSEEDNIRLGIDLCKTLELCEKAKIIHRDLKPDNILMTEDGICKLGDFGEAKNLELSTDTYSLKGTIAYMAPEIYLGKKYNNQVDIYSLGIILYRQMNRRRDPFLDMEKQLIYHKDREKALGMRMDGKEIPKPVDASEEFAEIICRACAYGPEERYRRAKDLRKDLELLLEGKYRRKNDGSSYKKKRFLRWGVAALAILMIGFFTARYVFSGVHYSLKEVYLSDQLGECKDVLVIDGSGALEKLPDCYKDAKYVIINEGITEIGEDVFAFNGSLEYISLPETMKTLAQYSFYNCYALEEVALPDSMTEISTGAFTDCEALTRMNLPTGLQSVGDTAFMGCTSLETVTIPANVTEIGECAFQGCYNLSSVELAEESQLSRVGSQAFANTKWIETEKSPVILSNILIYVPEEGENLILELPENVTKIGDGFCQNYEQLKEVVIPEGIIEIGRDAFEGCISLTNVVVPKSVETIGEGAFDGCPAAGSIN